MGRFIRIVKADEEVDEDGFITVEDDSPTRAIDVPDESEKKKKGAPKLTQQQMAERIELGRRALSPYMVNLARSPPKDGENIDYAALYDDIIFANNHMLADAFGLDETQRYEQKLDDEGEVDIPSIMDVPMITKPILTALDKMIEMFGDELRFAKESDEAENGSLEKDMKRHRVGDHITHRIQEARFAPVGNKNNKRRNLLNYFKEQTNHPIRYTSIQDIADIPRTRNMVRVKPSRGFSQQTGDFEQQLNEEAAKQRAALGELERDKRYSKENEVDAAKKFYEEKVFPKVDMVSRDIVPPKVGEMNKWIQLVKDKKAQNGLDNDMQAVRMVQEDVDNHMKIFMQQHSIGTAGRGARASLIGIGKAPSIVTPSFYEVARRFGVPLDPPNAPDNFTRFFLRGDEPTDAKNRMKIVDDPPESNENLHPAIQNALGGGGLFQRIAEEKTPGRVGGFSMEDASGGSFSEAEGRVADDPTALGSQQDIPQSTLEDKDKRARMMASFKGNSSKQAPKSSALVDLDFRRKYGNMSDDEYFIQRDKVINSESDSPRITYFDEIPDGEDFPEGHPYHGLSQDKIVARAKLFYDQLVGSGRHLLQFEKRLQKLGMKPSDIEKLQLTHSDIQNIHSILHHETPDAQLSTYSSKEQKKYDAILSTGITAPYVNKLNKDLKELRDKITELNIDPIQIANMGMQYAKSGFSEQGYRQAFAGMIGKLGGDVSKGDALRVIHAIRRINETRAEDIAHATRVRNQHIAHREHHRAKAKEGENDEDISDERKAKLLSGPEDCLACAPSRFSNSTREEARLHSPKGGFDNMSAFKHKRVRMPRLTRVQNPLTGSYERIEALPFGEGDTRVTLKDIADFIADDDEYTERLMEKRGLLDKNLDSKIRGPRVAILEKQLKKFINNAVKNIEDPNHIRAEMIDKKFGIEMKDEMIGKTGAAMRSAAERVAYGMIFPSNFNNDKQREQNRIRQMNATQMSGIIEGFGLLRDMANGTLKYKEGDREKQISVNNFKKGNRPNKEELRKVVVGSYKNASSAARRSSKLERYEALMEEIGEIEDVFNSEMAAFESKYGKAMATGVHSKKSNENTGLNTHAELLERKKMIKKFVADELNDRLQSLSDGTFELSKPAMAGTRVIEVPRHTFKMHNLKGKMNVDINGKKYEVIAANPPRRKADGYQMVLSQPLEEDIEEGRDAVKIADENHRNKLLFQGEMAKFEKDAFNNGVADVGEYFSKLKKRMTKLRKSSEHLASNSNFDERNTQLAFGALMQSAHLMLPLLKEKDSDKVLEGLQAIKKKIYTDSGGAPIPDLFVADGAGNETRSFIYRPNEYLTGKVGRTGGTGITYLDNNRLLPPLRDIETIKALNMKIHGKELTQDEIDAIMDAQHNEFNPHLNEEDLMKIFAGEDLEQDVVNHSPTKSGMAEWELRDQIHSQAFDLKEGEENWLKGGATPCGTCGGRTAVSMDDAISFIQSHNPNMSHASRDGKKMREYIAATLRPVGGPNGGFANFSEHPLSDMKEPHEFNTVVCPDCDHSNPDSASGRCADGICSHCHGQGIRDPNNAEELLDGYSHIDEDGNMHMYDGKRHSPHYGENLTISDLQDMINKTVGGFEEKPNLVLDQFREAMERGQVAPVTELEAVKRMAAERYGVHPEQLKANKTFEAIVRQAKKEEDRRLKEESLKPAEEMKEQAINQVLGDSTAKRDSLNKGHHNHEIKTRADRMLQIAQVITDKTNTPFDMNAFMELYNEVVNDENRDMAHGDAEHQVQKNLSKMHHMLTTDFIQADKSFTGRMPLASEDFNYGIKDKDADRFLLEDGKIRRTQGTLPRRYDSLIYKHGRHITEVEDEEGIFEPNSRAVPHLTKEEIRDFFGNSKELLEAFDRHHGNQFDADEAKEIKALVKSMEKPLVNKKLTGMSHPKLDEMLDKFNVSSDFRETLQNQSMEKAENTWDDNILGKQVGGEGSRRTASSNRMMKYFSYKPEGAYYRKGFDSEYNDSIRSVVKPMLKQYLLFKGMESLFDSYDDISHPRIAQEVARAAKSRGLPASTRLDAGNFYQLTALGGGSLISAVHNAAAREMGFEDESALEKGISLRNEQIGASGVNGKHFKDLIIANANSEGQNVAMPKTVDEIFNDTVQGQYSTNSRERLEDMKIAKQMTNIAYFKYYPNWMRQQRFAAALAKSGYSSGKELQEAMQKGEVPQEIIDDIIDADKSAKMHHSTITFPSYDNTLLYDANALGAHKKEQQARQQQAMQPAQQPAQAMPRTFLQQARSQQAGAYGGFTPPQVTPNPQSMNISQTMRKPLAQQRGLTQASQEEGIDPFSQ